MPRHARGRALALGPLRLVPSVLRDAAGVYWRHLPRVLPLAVVVFGLAAVADAALGPWAEVSGRDLAERHLAAFLASVALAGVLAVLSAFAEVFFAGLLDYVVEADAHGHPSPPLGAMLRRAPYRRLALTDLALLGVVGAGFVLFLLPGFAAWTLLGLAGPLVVAEGLSPRRALRRSFDLLRPRLGAAIALVLVPMLADDALSGWLAGLAHGAPLALRIAVEVGFDATVAAFTGLLLAVLAHRLIAASRATRPAPA